MSTIFDLRKSYKEKDTPVSNILDMAIEEGLSRMDFVLRDEITESICNVLCDLIKKIGYDELSIASACLYVEDFLPE